MEIKKLNQQEFPKALLEIPQPPKNLYILGELPPPNLIYLCIVGSRKNTSYGREACEKIIDGLKDYPIVIVSGLALGIDAIAHKKALAVGLKILVFPGSGLAKEVMYPRTNALLAEEIVASGGCLISEFEPDFRATMWSFAKRNRLMAGISKAVLIIEAEERSGTLITARLATEYNRDVLAIPGSIFSPNAKGTNRLIRDGATPITCVEDILSALGFEIKKDPEKQKSLFADLSSQERMVVNILREPLSRDELFRALEMSTPEGNSLLSIMEIKGILKEEFGEIKLV